MRTRDNYLRFENGTLYPLFYNYNYTGKDEDLLIPELPGETLETFSDEVEEKLPKLGFRRYGHIELTSSDAIDIFVDDSEGQGFFGYKYVVEVFVNGIFWRVIACRDGLQAIQSLDALGIGTYLKMIELTWANNHLSGVIDSLEDFKRKWNATR